MPMHPIARYTFPALLVLSLSGPAAAGPEVQLAQNDSTRANSEKAEEKKDVMESLQEAREVATRMEGDSRLKELMQQAKGIFIVPQYTKAGLGIGGTGGTGVLVVESGGKWSSPALYDLGGISVGAQAGIETGAVAMLLMSDKALENFKQEDKFSLDADAGLTIANYTAQANIKVGRDDVVLWTDTRGAFAGASVGASDIAFDSDDNAALYEPGVSAADILDGKVSSEQAKSLTAALPAPTGGSSAGKSGTEEESGSGKSSGKK